MKHPTKTTRIEKAWLGEINRRWREFWKVISVPLKQPVITNAEFAMSAQRQREYMEFLNNQIERILLNGGDNWQAKYQLSSYERSLEAIRKSLSAQGASLVPTAAEVSQAATLTPAQFAATPSLVAGRTMAMPPIHQETLEFLYTRGFESLEGWTDKFSRETRQILMEGVQQGKNTNVVAREIQQRLGVSRSRARVIAQTETIQAYQQGASNEAKRAEIEIGEEIGMRWQTAGDERVRPLHRGWNNTVVSQEENASRITQSVYNCRCSQAPVLMDE